MKALKRSDGAKGGKPPYDPVLMFQVSVLQGTTTCRTIRDYQAKFQIQDRLAFRRFLGLADKLPDAKTIWLFREHWVEAGAVKNLFVRFDKHRMPAAGGVPWRGVGTSISVGPR
ncbi:MAG: transposase [Pseudomonadota bacterium]|nr:transposase [Pseudomonadota bacterium]